MATGTSLSRTPKSAPAFASLHTFFRWWSRELAWFIPLSLKERGLPASDMVWLRLSAEQVVFSRFQGGKLHDVTRLTLTPQDPPAEKIAFDKLWRQFGKTPVGVLVGADQVLTKTLALPLAARENLDQVLAFELDRHFPYRADQVFHVYQPPVLAGERLNITVAVLPRHVLQPLLGRIQEWHLTLHGIAMAERLGAGRGYLNLLPTSLRPKTGRQWPWLWGLMSAITLLLFGLYLAIPLWQKRETAMALVPKVTQAERQAKAAADLKDKMNQALARHNYLIEKRLTTPPQVAILEEVSRLMPDNTWAQSLEIRGQELMIQGETGSSSRLVSLFSNSKLLGEANHKSPLVKVQDGLERFQLAVAIQSPTLDEAMKLLAESQGGKKTKSGVAQ